jgi:hypothetical protein
MERVNVFAKQEHCIDVWKSYRMYGNLGKIEHVDQG